MSNKRFGLLYGLLQVLVPISFFYYYRKHTIVKHQKIPKKTPIIFITNHQNTLVDPFVVGIAAQRQTGFLARASAFKNPLVAKILHSLKMKPLYRPRDGMENLGKNDEIFKACFEVLSNQQSFAMFPEGSHDRTRHLRLFKKGFARIALGAVEESNFSLKVKIVPAGLNYSDHLYQGGDLLILIGEPIEVADYIETYKQNQPKAINELKKDVYNRIKTLIIHIEDLEHYEMIDSLRKIYRQEMQKRLNLENGNRLLKEFKADKKTIEIIENYIKTNKEEAAVFENKIKEYTHLCDNYRIKEQVFIYPNNLFTAFSKTLLLLILFPVFVFSFINSFIPYFFIRYIIKNKVEDDHFYSAFKMAIGMFLFPIFYLLITIPVLILFGIKISILYYTGLFFTAMLALLTRQVFRNMKQNWIFVFEKFRKKESFRNLINLRKEIIQIMNKIVEKN